MKNLLITVACFALCSSQAFAGTTFGPGAGGGGGTLNPHPVSFESITDVASSSGLIISAWFRGQEIKFRKLSLDAQASSPFKKVFADRQRIYDVIKNTSIEVRSTKPCLDSTGQPWDGSIFANDPNAICLSAYLMGPKLNEFSINAEETALVAHEMSHLLGTNEQEATAIQMAALSDLSSFQFSTLRQNLERTKMQLISIENNRFLVGQAEMDWTEAVVIEGQIREIYPKLSDTSDDPAFLWIPSDLYERFKPEYAHFATGSLFVCADGSGAAPVVKANCKTTLVAAFGNNETTSSRQLFFITDFLANDVLGISKSYSPDYDLVILANPRTAAIANSEFQKFASFVGKVGKNLGDSLARATKISVQ